MQSGGNQWHGRRSDGLQCQGWQRRNEPRGAAAPPQGLYIDEKKFLFVTNSILTFIPIPRQGAARCAEKGLRFPVPTC